MSNNPSFETNPALQGEAWLYSYPKSGRTWLRYMIARTFIRQYKVEGVGHDFQSAYRVIPADDTHTLAFPSKRAYPFTYEGILPKVGVSHSVYTPELHANVKDPLMVIRDPRDTIVSHWLHLTKQKRFEGDLSSFIRDPLLGIDGYLEYHSGWAPHVENDPITYEAVKADPHAQLGNIFNHLGIAVAEETISYAVEQGSFENMRRQEISHGVPLPVQNANDQESLRVRRGKIGGFSEYMSPPDRAYIDTAIARADSMTQSLISHTGYVSSL
jgi:hypothetical protein